MIPFCIFILSIGAIAIGSLVASHCDYWSSWRTFSEVTVFVAIIAAFLSLLIFPSYEESYKLFPVEYSVATSNNHIAVATNYGVFQSSKIEDLNDWTKNKPGYLKIKYNVFGFECQQYSFVTENK